MYLILILIGYLLPELKKNLIYTSLKLNFEHFEGTVN